nr:unnamed protein product [Callosobruchus chinensis]
MESGRRASSFGRSTTTSGGTRRYFLDGTTTSSGTPADREEPPSSVASRRALQTVPRDRDLGTPEICNTTHLGSSQARLAFTFSLCVEVK